MVVVFFERAFSAAAAAAPPPLTHRTPQKINDGLLVSFGVSAMSHQDSKSHADKSYITTHTLRFFGLCRVGGAFFFFPPFFQRGGGGSDEQSLQELLPSS
jgi:hypothetical protein